MKKENPDCCYYQCHQPGAIHIGANGGDSRWICFRHYYKWNADRARFLADGGGCEMQELGELLDQECWSEANGKSRFERFLLIWATGWFH